MAELPTIRECIKLLRYHDTPHNIFLHVRKVAAVGTLLAAEINRKESEQGRPSKVNRKLLEVACLLHDAKKMHEIKGLIDCHITSGAQMLEERGYPEVARLVEKHEARFSDIEHFDSIEEALLCYADKRVKHDEITSIKGRMEDLAERYGKDDQRKREKILAYLKPLRKLEQYLFKGLQITPEDITEESVKSYLIPDTYKTER